MKKILLSVMSIALVSATAFGVTRAFFTDTETSSKNTFTTGTIDIAVDNQNPWSSRTPYQFTDMKPSQVEYANFTVNNVGTNPVNVWKKLTVTGTSDTPISEPECVEGHGVWTEGNCTGDYSAKSDIDTVIDYDLSVKLYNNSNELIWWQMIYDKNVTVADIKDKDVFLGMIPEGWHIDVVQSYHMKSDTGNWAQGDSMTFDITLTGEQLKGVAVLEDKTGEPDWRVKTETSAQGTLTYGVKDSKFNFSFIGVAPLINTDYSLIVYKEPWSTPGSAAVWPRPVIVLGQDTSDVSGNVVIPNTSVELNTNLFNTKIWLVKTSDLTADTISGWNPTDYLFDTGLIDYYDSDL